MMRLSRRPAILAPESAGYPEALRELPEPPPIRVVGVLPDADRAVAVVGTRRADVDACRFTRRLATDLAAAGWAIVSGGAVGVDASAHRGALAAGGSTVAVLATGLRLAYPRRHRALFEEIAASGALVSEAPDDQVPFPGVFLQRNRLIAALSRAVVVVQAPVRSGALSTARWAQQLSRPVLAVPWGPTDPRGAGCLSLLRHGATICTSARDVLSVAAPGDGSGPTDPQAVRKVSCNYEGICEDGRAVLARLGSQPHHVDELVQAVGIPAARVQRAVLTLVLHGLVEPRGPGRYVRIG